MAGRISIKDSGKYASQSGNDFFILENDGDVAKVRILYTEPDGSDLDYYLVHEVEIDGKRRYVACNAVAEDGSLDVDQCPLCQEGYKRIEKLFIQLYNLGTDKVETWDRGRSFVPKILTYINRYQHLDQYPIEIERRGKKGASNTTYELFMMEPDDQTLEDFPEKQELLGSFIIEATEDDMYAMIDGEYTIPGSDNNSDNASRGAAPRSRSSRSNNAAAPRSRSSRTSHTEDKPSENKAPARSRNRRGNRSSAATDAF